MYIKSRDFWKKRLKLLINRRIIIFFKKKSGGSGKIKKIRRNKMGLFGIFFYQVIVSGSKIDVVDPRKIAHPVM